ncbi:MAG: hypothetical protein V3R99_00695 [Thermoguttaceae bacterium]
MVLNEIAILAEEILGTKENRPEEIFVDRATLDGALEYANGRELDA